MRAVSCDVKLKAQAVFTFVISECLCGCGAGGVVMFDLF